MSIREQLRPRSERNLYKLALATFLLLSGPVISHADVVPLTSEQMIRHSKNIVVATVESQATRWNTQRTLILTDYELALERQLKGSRQQQRLTVSVIGGSLDGETQTTSLATPLEIGGRYVFFLQDIDQQLLSPFTGVWQGIIREMREDLGKTFAAGGPQGQRRIGGPDDSFGDFVATLVELIRSIEASPGDPNSAITPSHGASREQTLPSKIFAPTGSRFTMQSTLGRSPASTADNDPTPMTPSSPVPEMSSNEIAQAPTSEKYRIEHWPDLPVVFEAFPSDWIWSPHDQFMMSSWNIYTSEIFRVYAQTDGIWAWKNDVFELAGWPSNAQMIAQFGAGWPAGVLGVTYSRRGFLGLGSIIEADIALNPAFNWTLDNAYGTRGDNTVQSFEHTMLHELGHAFGVKHPWETQNVWWDSVMNYAPKQYRLPTLHADDAEAVRTAYPGTSIHDGLVTFYETHDNPIDSGATYDEGDFSSTLLTPGGTFSISDLMLQNAGTDNIVNPVIEIYLTPSRLSWSGLHYLASKTLNVNLAPFSSAYFSLTSIPVPQTLPPGTYYGAIYLRDASDGNTGNNSAWSSYNNRVTVQAASNLAIFADGFESGSLSAWSSVHP